MLTLGGVGLYTWNWVRSLQIPINAAPTPVPVNSFPVQHTAPYAGLSFTVLNAQYALFFNDDTIRSGPATVRLNMQVANTGTSTTSLVYYEIAHLLAPNLNPIAPTNVSLSSGPKPGSSEKGWIDFPVPKGTALNTLQLQLGSVSLDESMVTIPFTGTFDPGQYADKTFKQSLDISYTYHAQYGFYLTYHLVGVDRLFSYNGSQAKTNQRFYSFHFKVDNPNGTDVSPGYGFDYIRLVLGSVHPPIDNTLPYSFKAGSHGVSGQVVFVGPANLHSATLRFMDQYGSGGQDYAIGL
jgi:hypothetical protein